MSRHRLLRWTVAASVSATLIAAAVPATAATVRPAVTKVVVHVAPATVLRGGLVTFSGSVTPRLTGVPVLVERFAAGRWQTVALEKVSSAGLLSFSIKAPHATGAWILRVTRVATAKTKTGISATLHLRVVSSAFAVTAKAAIAPDLQVLVTGVVNHKATGAVWLQQLVGKTWHDLSSGKLAHSAFVLKATLPTGAHSLRVVKLFTTTIAGGLSKSFVVHVPTEPVVTTMTLAPATARRAYSAALAASGGVPPYSWTGSGLPAGLSVSAGGAISGTPAVAGTSAVTVTVRDSAGRTAAASLSLSILATSGTVWSWGTNDSDQLGNGSAAVSSSAPTQVVGLTDAVQVVGAGSAGAYAVRANGTVAAWGVNTFDALGDGTTDNSNVPVAVTGLTGVIAVDAGIFCGNALKSDGTVWSWGYGGSDQLGNGTTTNAAAPVQASNLTGVTAIASNGGDSYALKSDGTVWAWGTGANGSLGNGGSIASSVPTKVSLLSGVVAIAGSQESGYALKSDGTVWAWGWNAYGQLGNASIVASNVPVQVQGLTNVTAIGGGSYAGMALKSDGTVWDWGYNQYGALGNGLTTNSSIPVAVSGLATVVAIAGGGQSGYAVKADGSAWAWGQNSLGELGNGSTTVSSIPVSVAVLHDFFSIGAGNASAYGIDFG